MSVVFLGCIASEDETAHRDFVDLQIQLDPDDYPFYYGVSSGDPQPDRLVIWTKAIPEYPKAIDVTWRISKDSLFRNIVSSGKIKTDSSNYYTVKVDVDGLEPATMYFYQFEFDKAKSLVGITKTLPESITDSLRMAIVSCSNLQWGYFNAYRMIAKKDIDLVIHLGDYIYEHAQGGYGDTSIGRLHLPDREIVSAKDYRTRYAQYRLDPDLKLIHQKLPFICIWDDHEITNNAYMDGAQNHQPEEGSYEIRKEIARKAYYEWLPVREDSRGELYRILSCGDLADIIILDERLAGRTRQADSIGQVDSSFTMLGQSQLL